MIYKAFQDLYQHVKKTDPRLFETLDRINVYLKDLILQSNIGQTEPLLADNTVGLFLSTSYQLIPSIALRLSRPGWWVINVDCVISADKLDTFENVILTYGAPSLTATGGVQFVGGIVQFSSAGIGNLVLSGGRSWRLEVASPIVIQAQAKKLGGTGSSGIIAASMIASYVG